MVAKTLYGGAVVIVAIHAYAAFNPTALNWGIHHLGFFPLELRLTWLALAAVLLLPPVTRVLVHWLQGVISALGKMNTILLYALTSIGAITVFWIFRSKLYLLGDGLLDLRAIDRAPLPVRDGYFEREPLAGTVHWFVHQFVLKPLGIGAPEMAYVLVSITCGAVFIVFLVRLAQLLTSMPLERALIVGFILFSGIAQFFFGYVENYTVLAVTMLGYFIAAVSYLQRRTPLIVPSLVFAIMLALQAGVIALGPSLLYLYYLEFRSNRVRAGIAGVVTIVAVVGILMLCGYSVEALSRVVLMRGSASGTHILPLTTIGADSQAYTLFSFWHLVDIVNEQLIVAPFGLLLVMVGWWANRKKQLAVSSSDGTRLGKEETQPDKRSGGQKAKRHIHLERSELTIFLVIAALVALALTVIFNCEIGASRDWDVMGVYQLPMMVLAVYLVTMSGEVQKAVVPVVVGVIALTFWHTIPWIGVDAEKEMAFTRFECLRDRRLWSQHAGYYALRSLTYELSGNNQVGRALAACEAYISEYPMDVRGYVYEANAYYQRGEKEKEFSVLRRAFQSNMCDYSGLIHLGNHFLERANLDSAVLVWQRAIEVDSNGFEAYNNLGALYLQKHDYHSASYYLNAASQRDTSSSKIEIYRNIGMVHYFLNDYAKAAEYWTKYLDQMTPHPSALGIYKNVGLAYFHMKDYRNAERYWKTFLELAPNHPDAEIIRHNLQAIRNRSF